MSTITLSETQALALAKQYRAASVSLRKFRFANEDKLSKAKQDQLKLIEESLRDAARDMTTAAVIIIIDESQTGLAALGAVTNEAIEVLDTIKGIKMVLSVATALLGLAAAIPTGNPEEVFSAFGILRELLTSKAEAKPLPVAKLPV
jgi:hypothetical protein